jgi:hypothetical protein
MVVPFVAMAVKQMAIASARSAIGAAGIAGRVVTGAKDADNFGITYAWDKAKLEKTLLQLEQFGKKKNRVLVPAARAGAVVFTREIRKGLPAYKPRRAPRGGGRRMKEAKSAVGTKAGIEKRHDGIVKKGQVFAKAGAGVGKKQERIGDRQERDRPGVGLGPGSLHLYLAGTKPRYTRTGVYTGRMRRPMLVPSVQATHRNRSLRATLVRAKKGLKKLYKDARK